MKDTLAATRLCFVTVSIWWLAFSIPIFRNLKERGTVSPAAAGRSDYVKARLGNLINTFKHITQYTELFKFLIAFWLYNDAIGTIIGMATIYGREIGIGQTSLMGALLLTQLAGFPFTLLFGKYANKLGAKNSLYICLTVYAVISVGGYFMTSAVHFWILAFLVSTSQGASQALSRSLYSTLVPANQSAEFFGFYSVFNKLSEILGPFVFALVGQLTGNSRYGIFSLLVFVVIDGVILYTVDVEKGHRQNQAAIASQNAESI